MVNGIECTIGDQLDRFTYLVACHYCYIYYDFYVFICILWQINSLSAERSSSKILRPCRFAAFDIDLPSLEFS